jgi:autotransporter-associated beta strand protein
LTKLGAGTLILTGANPWGVTPIVAAGTLKGSTASLQTAITNNSKVDFDQAGDGTYAHVMSGTGGLEPVMDLYF